MVSEKTRDFVCQMCGKESTVNAKAHRKKYCPECADINFRKLQREYAQRKKERKKNNEPEQISIPIIKSKNALFLEKVDEHIEELKSYWKEAKELLKPSSRFKRGCITNEESIQFSRWDGRY